MKNSTRTIELSRQNRSIPKPSSGLNDVREKADKISKIFASLTENIQNRPTTNPGIINNKDVSSSKDSQLIKVQARSIEEFYQRVSTFIPGLWTINQITPLECALYGWKLLEKNVLQCVTCQEVVCAILPDKKDKVAYDKFFSLLKDRLETNHKDACSWLYNPCPNEFLEPIVVTSDELRNMKNSVQTLALLNSALPFLNNNRITAALGADDQVINSLLTTNDVAEDTKITAVLLVLCGWCKGEGAYLRCNICRRLVGLWSLITIADELKKTETPKPSLAKSSLSSKKRKLSENDDTADNDDNDKRVTRQSPRKLKNQDSVDGTTPKRMRTESKEEKMDEQEDASTPQANVKKKEYLIITSPSTEVEKIEKKYFCPLEEHRHWCPWVAKVDDDDEDPQKGFCIVTEQVRSVVQMLEERKSALRGNCVENIEGLRNIRNLLDEVSGD